MKVFLTNDEWWLLDVTIDIQEHEEPYAVDVPSYMVGDFARARLQFKRAEQAIRDHVEKTGQEL